MTELTCKEVSNLKKEAKIIVRSKLLPHPNGTYEGKVVQVTPCFVSVELKAIRSTLPAGTSFGEPKPYVYSIHYADVGTNDHVFVA